MTLQAINLGVRFVLELCLLAALGYWGFRLDQPLLLRIVAGVGAPLVAAVVWGFFVAPKAANRLIEPWRLGLEIILFGLGAGALYLAQRPLLAAALFAGFLANRALILIWRQPA